MNNIDKLKQLTEELPVVPKLEDLVESNSLTNHSVIYDVKEGTSFGFGLLSRPEASVMELFVSKGTAWPDHLHEDENEWGILYKGKLKVVIDGKEIILTPGQCVHFKKEVVHSSEAIEDSWLIAIAVPKLIGYPE